MSLLTVDRATPSAELASVVVEAGCSEKTESNRFCRSSAFFARDEIPHSFDRHATKRYVLTARTFPSSCGLEPTHVAGRSRW